MARKPVSDDPLYLSLLDSSHECSGSPVTLVWDASSGKELFTFCEPTDAVFCVAFSPDGKRILRTGEDKRIVVWDVRPKQESLAIRGRFLSITDMAVSPDGKYVVSANLEMDGKGGGLSGVVKVWGATTGNEVRVLRNSSLAMKLAFSPDGKRLVVGTQTVRIGEHSSVKVLDFITGEELIVFPGHTAPIQSVVFSPDGNSVASASNDNTMKLYDSSTGKEVLTFSGHTGLVSSASFSPDGRHIVTASHDKTVKVWDAITGEELHSLRGHTDRVTCVKISPDGRRCVSSSADKTVKVWDIVKGREVHTLSGHRTAINCVSYSPDGKRIVSGSGTVQGIGEIKIWDAKTYRIAITLHGHRGSVDAVAFSRDGKLLVSSGHRDRTMRVWNATPLE